MILARRSSGFPYFLDLAYDIDVWGGQDAAITTQYTAQWVRRNFGAAFAPADLPRIEGIITDYTRLLARRKHEKMGRTPTTRPITARRRKCCKFLSISLPNVMC